MIVVGQHIALNVVLDIGDFMIGSWDSVAPRVTRGSCSLPEPRLDVYPSKNPPRARRRRFSGRHDRPS
jgi:hypothetical protein